MRENNIVEQERDLQIFFAYLSSSEVNIYIVEDVSYGELTLGQKGLKYIPDDGFVGEDSFQIVFANGEDYSFQTVNISVVEDGVEVSGVVIVEEYVSNSKVCIDVNKNVICDEVEPYGFTNSNGEFSFSASATDLEHPVIAEIDANSETLSGDIDEQILLAPPNSYEVISPLSTLVVFELDPNPYFELQEESEHLDTTEVNI